MAVHTYGLPADLNPLLEIAARHGIKLIEDASQMQGQSYRKKPCGSFGDISTFSFYPNKHVTTGEGGAMITDRQDLLDLAIDVHDCAGSVRREAGLPQFAGWNFRASEIQGAIARVQLRRLDGLLERMRAGQAAVAERVAALPGLRLRRANDDGGDAGICLVAFAANAALATEAVEALRAEGVLAMRIYDPGFVDLHVYPYWKPVLDAIAAEGRPAPHCPRTLELLERSIHVDLSPLNDEQDLDETAFAFEKIAAGVL